MSDTVMLGAPKEMIEAWEFPVSIGSQEHAVLVQKDYWRKLTKEKISSRELVFRSVLFLLEREPKEAILKAFDIADIMTYFPEYEAYIQKTL